MREKVVEKYILESRNKERKLERMGTKSKKRRDECFATLYLKEKNVGALFQFDESSWIPDSDVDRTSKMLETSASLSKLLDAVMSLMKPRTLGLNQPSQGYASVWKPKLPSRRLYLLFVQYLKQGVEDPNNPSENHEMFHFHFEKFGTTFHHFPFLHNGSRLNTALRGFWILFEGSRPQTNVLRKYQKIVVTVIQQCIGICLT